MTPPIRSIRVLRALGILWLHGMLAGCWGAAPADLILTNGAIYTMNSEQPWAEAMAIRDGRVVAVGDSADIRARFAGHERDLGGAMVLPGFHDSHAHPVTAGVDLGRCDLKDSATVEAILATVAECDSRLPGDTWLIGRGWSLALFADANPSRVLLDGINDQRPILLRAADGHSSWANSRALAMAGIRSDTPDPELGVIERDGNGEPGGTLRESAQDLLWTLAPEPTFEERSAGLVRAMSILNSVGVTSLIDAAVNAPNLAVYQQLAADQALTLRVVASMGGWDVGDAALADPGLRESAARLRTDAVKIFLDGTLEGETAALLEPYLGPRGGTRGRLTLPQEALNRQITELDARGIQVHVHAIGDWAVRAALDAFAASRRANGPRDNRHLIAHLQLVDPADYPRFAELGVTADFQSVWAYPDEYIVDLNLGQVGPERVNRMYPIGSLERAGARIAAGSDWPVSTPNPLLAIEVALTRQDPTGERAGALNAEEEAVSLPTMLRAYTVNGAWLMHQDSRVGMLAPGMLADLVVLERNLFDIPPDEIGEVRVLATYLEGVPVFERAP